MAKTVIDIKGIIVADDDKWVYDWFGYKAVSPSDVIGKIGVTADELEININSGGGDVFAANEIYTAIRSHTGKVNINIVGLAGSAASYIATAGKCRISPVGMIMIHNVSSAARGDYHAMDKESEVLQQINKAIAAAYRDKTGMTEDELLALMDKETWMTAEEAVSMHFCDGIIKNSNGKEKDSNQQPFTFGNITQFAACNGVLLDRETIENARIAIRGELSTPDDTKIDAPQGEDKSQTAKRDFIQNKMKEGNEMAAEENKKEITTVEELTASYPGLVKQISDSASEAATKAENERIKGIDDIAAKVPDKMVSEAKYGNCRITASELALKSLQANAQAGKDAFDTLKDEIKKSGTKDVTTEPNTGFTADPTNAEKESKIKALAEKLRK